MQRSASTRALAGRQEALALSPQMTEGKRGGGRNMEGAGAGRSELRRKCHSCQKVEVSKPQE